jgi:hypothetical protein
VEWAAPSIGPARPGDDAVARSAAMITSSDTILVEMMLAGAIAGVLIVAVLVGIAGVRSLRTFVRSLWPH